jgi:predicted phosphodiesterase
MSDRNQKISASDFDRLIVIGDVHGCKEPLESLLAKVSADSTKDIIAFVGDFVCRGPDSKGVLDLIRQRGYSAVKGNHELNLTSRNAVNEKDTRVTTADLLWLESLPTTLEITALNTLIVHGGVFPGVALNFQSDEELTRIRNIENSEARNSNDVGEPWFKDYIGPWFVIFGHNHQTEVVQGKFYAGIDTGCVWGGKLTAAVIHRESRKIEFVSVNCCQFLGFLKKTREIYINSHYLVNTQQT